MVSDDTSAGSTEVLTAGLVRGRFCLSVETLQTVNAVDHKVLWMIQGMQRCVLRKTLQMMALLLPLGIVQAAQKNIEVRIEQRKVIEPGDVVRAVKGDTVTLRWKTDEKVALHLHGYDIMLEVEPGRVEEMHFEANVSGRFPVTSHGFGGGHGHRHAALFYIEIYPE